MFITIPSILVLYFAGVFKFFENDNQKEFKKKQIEAVLQYVNERPQHDFLVKVLLKKKNAVIANWIPNSIGIYESRFSKANILNLNLLFETPNNIIDKLLQPKQAILYLNHGVDDSVAVPEGTKYLFKGGTQNRIDSSLSGNIDLKNVYYGINAENQNTILNVYYPKEISDQLKWFMNFRLEERSLRTAITETEGDIVILFPMAYGPKDSIHNNMSVWRLYQKGPSNKPIELGDFVLRSRALRKSIVEFLNKNGIAFNASNFHGLEDIYGDGEIKGIIDTTIK